MRVSCALAISVGLLAGPVVAERFKHGVLPYTHSPRLGNNMTVITELGERFEGRAWWHGNSGYFCFSGAETTCGGRYDASHAKEKLEFAFECLDGRRGLGVSSRLSDGAIAEAFFAEGEFRDQVEFKATFGPTKTFKEGVGCWY